MLTVAPPFFARAQVVLLSDNGLSVSQRSLAVYCQVRGSERV